MTARGVFVSLFICSAVATFATGNLVPEASAQNSLVGVDVDLADLDLYQLLNVRVQSVARKEQSLFESAAAAFVLTNEDIRRSGVTTIPDALRLVPGITVSKISASSWAVSARGFHGRFNNKLLTLVDGRSVYTPVFGGTYWEQQDVMLEDVEQIEVIRGPGAALWGSNAVNGVINIITKSSKDTQGGLISGGGGTEEKGFVAARYGGEISGNTTYRLHGKYANRDDSDADGGVDAADDWQQGSVGFRIDSEPTDRDKVTVIGNASYTDLNNQLTGFVLSPPFTQTVRRRGDTNAANILTRWQHEYEDGSDAEIQLYYDHTTRNEISIDHSTDTIDLDFQYRSTPFENHEILVGGSYRLYSDDLEGDFFLPGVQSFPEDGSLSLYTWFLQDEISLLDDSLILTVGSKFEHNEFSGFEFQPNVRAVYLPSERHAVWAAVSRAVRIPSRAQEDLNVAFAAFPNTMPPPATTVSSIREREGVKGENFIVYEAGYRAQPLDSASLDISFYYNDGDDINSLESGMPIVDVTSDGTAFLNFPMAFDNLADIEVMGIDVVANIQANDWWRIVASYSWLEFNSRVDVGSTDTLTPADNELGHPENMFTVRSLVDLGSEFEFDSTLRYVDIIRSALGDSYAAVDLRLGWRPKEDLELSLVAQNLFHNNDVEFVDLFQRNGVIETEAGVFAKATFRF